MIKLANESDNIIYLSLTQDSSNAYGNYFLLELVNLQTRESVKKVVDRDFTNVRYVKLSFNVNTGAEPKYTLQTRSFYKYNVYEQTSSTNTDPNNASVLGLRETGKAWLDGSSEVSYIKEEEADKTNKVYLKV
tara:strand:- start:1729 stop:2127 length:399 start_codon:yes stop_codon:yes gene_type:complete